MSSLSLPQVMHVARTLATVLFVTNHWSIVGKLDNVCNVPGACATRSQHHRPSLIQPRQSVVVVCHLKTGARLGDTACAEVLPYSMFMGSLWAVRTIRLTHQPSSSMHDRVLRARFCELVSFSLLSGIESSTSFGFPIFGHSLNKNGGDEHLMKKCRKALACRVHVY